MTTATQAIQWEAKYTSQPGDNGGRFAWTLAGAPGYTGSAWCGAFQFACAKNLGLDLGPFALAAVMYVPSALNVARQHGLYRVSKDSQPGDWVIFDWSGRERGADHIGMIVANDPSKSYVTTIEGNAGAAANGQRHVAYHTRSRSLITGTINRQAAYSKPAPKPKPIAPDTTKGLAVDGLMGQSTVNRWAAVMGTNTGRHDLIVEVQKYLNRIGCHDENGHKLTVDGLCDLNNTQHKTAKQHTTAAVQRHLRTTIDGVWDSPSSGVKALQTRLNKAKTGSKEF